MEIEQCWGSETYKLEPLKSCLKKNNLKQSLLDSKLSVVALEFDSKCFKQLTRRFVKATYVDQDGDEGENRENLKILWRCPS